MIKKFGAVDDAKASQEIIFTTRGDFEESHSPKNSNELSCNGNRQYLILIEVLPV